MKRETMMSEENVSRQWSQKLADEDHSAENQASPSLARARPPGRPCPSGPF